MAWDDEGMDEGKEEEVEGSEEWERGNVSDSLRDKERQNNSGV